MVLVAGVTPMTRYTMTAVTDFLLCDKYRDRIDFNALFKICKYGGLEIKLRLPFSLFKIYGVRISPEDMKKVKGEEIRCAVPLAFVPLSF